METVPQQYVSALQRLERRIALLDERVTFLEGVLRAVPQYPEYLKLTPTETKLLKFLEGASPKFHKVAQIHDAIYQGIGDVDSGVVPVMVSRVRGKIHPFGVIIQSKSGFGYRLDEANATILQNLRGVS
jgi:DNA-binding response OmpR family regulator